MHRYLGWYRKRPIEEFDPSYRNKHMRKLANERYKKSETLRPENRTQSAHWQSHCLNKARETDLENKYSIPIPKWREITTRKNYKCKCILRNRNTLRVDGRFFNSWRQFVRPNEQNTHRILQCTKVTENSNYLPVITETKSKFLRSQNATPTHQRTRQEAIEVRPLEPAIASFLLRRHAQGWVSGGKLRIKAFPQHFA